MRPAKPRAAAPTITTLAAVALLALVAGGGCRTATAAAARDPMSCERDPNCARYKGSYSDCTRQCADSPECIDRCRSAQTDPEIGH